MPGPLYLWHIDGNYKLVRWHFVKHGGVHGFQSKDYVNQLFVLKELLPVFRHASHGGVHGFSLVIVFMNISDNTVLTLSYRLAGLLILSGLLATVSS